MTDGVIPEDVRQFLLKNIDSIAQWEGLLLLRAHPGAACDTSEIARNLYIPDHDVAALLAPLVARHILTASDIDGRTHYRYDPETAELDGCIGQVADFYKLYLIPITHFIHAKPAPSRVQEFANAFRIRKD
jgi:hypothetical protein